MDITAKIVDGSNVTDGRMFRVTAAVRGKHGRAAAAALSDAFGEAAVALVTWTASTLAASPGPEPAPVPK